MFSDEEEGRSFKDEEWPKRPAQTMGNMKCVRVFVGGGVGSRPAPLSPHSGCTDPRYIETTDGVVDAMPTGNFTYRHLLSPPPSQLILLNLARVFACRHVAALLLVFAYNRAFSQCVYNFCRGYCTKMYPVYLICLCWNLITSKLISCQRKPIG